MSQPAILLAHGYYRTPNGKASHGLVRGGERFRVRAVVDPEAAGHDAGVLLDGVHRDIPVVADLAAALAIGPAPARFAVIGVATHGGRLSSTLREATLEAIRAGLSVVNGLHDFLGEDPEAAELARRFGVELIDVRKPPPRRELHFWSGAVYAVTALRVAVLGTDCAIGKRTTARLLVRALNGAGIASEMIYTGQTGWMQGARYGLILDSLPNDYVSGELERAILDCARERQPRVMVIEGQSGLLNPSGPCGAEILLSGACHGVVLQHAPKRRYYEGFEARKLLIPPLERDVELLGHYGAPLLGLALNESGLTADQACQVAETLSRRFGVPVARPLSDGVSDLIAPIRQRLS